MPELNLAHKAYGSAEEISSNIRSALLRQLPELSPAVCRNDGTFVVVGSGPSLPKFLNEIASEREAGRPICAVNGAHDFLCDNGVTPELFLSVDPRDTIIGNTQKKNENTIYLIASRCSPALFDHLTGCKVMVWHSWSHDEMAYFPVKKMAIAGGSTSGLRAIQVGYVLGFRKFNVYGLDSCLADDGITKRFSGEKAGQIMDVKVGAENGRKFICNVPMAQQAQEAQFLMSVMPDIAIDFKGDGLLSAIWQERRRLGLPA